MRRGGAFRNSLFNPLRWSRRLVVVVLLTFYIVGGGFYVFGLSAFATNVGETVGVLRIPQVKVATDVRVALLDGDELLTPEKSAAIYERGGKKFIYGHNTTVFRNLDSIFEGDAIYFVDSAGAELDYFVTKVGYLSVDEIDMDLLLGEMSGENDLILMTCAGKIVNGDYDERLVIFARLNQ